MHTGLVQVNEMFVDLARLVKEQDVSAPLLYAMLP
jgi:acid stress-induced BolA-like protein IbaG/YrbA